MVRKFLSILLLLVLLCSFAACGQEDPVNSAEGSDTSSEVGSSQTGTDSQGTTDTESTNTSSNPKDPVQEVLEAGEYLVGLTDQLNKRIIICDLSVEDWSKDKAVVWKMGTYAGVAGIKFRDNEYWGGKVVIYCSGTQATIASYDKKRVLLNVTNAPVNSHSVELLPNGVFVVAGSTGNEVRIYGAGKKEYSDSVTFPSAHGVLWDPKYDVLWIEGSNQLQAFKVTGTVDAPKLTPVEGMKYTPNSSLHDMAPVYGNPDQLLLTGTEGVVLFDKTTGRVSYDYPAGGFLKTQSYVPGVGNYESGVCVFTTIRSDTLTYQEWGTDKVGIFVPVEGTVGRVIYRQAKSNAYYKARVVNFNYQ